MARFFRRVAAAAALALAAGCAGLAPAPDPGLEGLPTAFEMAGRLSVARGGAGEIVRIRWVAKEGRDEILLATPVGGDLARIEGSHLGWSLERPGTAPLAYDGLPALSEDLLSARLDRTQLVAWLHGRGGGESGPGGWSVALPETQSASGRTVARRVEARRGDVVVKLVVDRYRSPPE